jgi:hypothetical protein
MLFFSLVISGVLGLSVRHYFSSERLRGWIEGALRPRSQNVAIEFSGARLKLSRGSVPQLAVELSDVAVNTAPACRTGAAIRMARLSVPLRWLDLFFGKVALGVVSAEDLVVDLDGLKKRCESGSALVASESSEVSLGGAEEKEKGSSASVRPWWKPEQLAALQSMVDGIESTRVELRFEDQSKRVFLEPMLIETRPGSASVRFKADLRIPQEISYDEKVPVLGLDAEVEATKAMVRAKAVFSEGLLESRILFEPAAEGELHVDATVGVKRVPLSILVPLLTKTGIVKREFRPRFAWFGCEGRIKGVFRKIFHREPLHLEGCEIKGHGLDLRLASAVRRPDASWEPFVLEIVSADVARLLETFALESPDGVASDLGRISGQIQVEGDGQAGFSGRLQGLELRFSHKNERAHQKFRTLDLEVGLNGEWIRGRAGAFEIEGGEVEGSVSFAILRDASKGTIKTAWTSLALHQEIQKLLLGGQWSASSGEVEVEISAGEVSRLKGSLRFRELESRDVRLGEATVDLGLTSQGFVKVGVLAERMFVNRSAPFFVGLRPLFFEHEFAGSWIEIRDFAVAGHVPSEGGFLWEQAGASLEQGNIKISSVGKFTRERVLTGWIGANYPLAKHLKWKLAGFLDSPTVSGDSAALMELMSRHNRVSDQVLGLRMVSQESSAERDSIETAR